MSDPSFTPEYKHFTPEYECWLRSHFGEWSLATKADVLIMLHSACAKIATLKRERDGAHLQYERLQKGFEHQRRALDTTLENVREARRERDAALSIVREQANDEGLWFVARTAPEAYLQQELRRLHTAVENPNE